MGISVPLMGVEVTFTTAICALSVLLSSSGGLALVKSKNVIMGKVREKKTTTKQNFHFIKLVILSTSHNFSITFFFL